jgi:hypothetical protein
MRFTHLAAMLVATATLLEVHDGLACSEAWNPPLAEITGLEVSTQVVDDPKSTIACSPGQGASCGPDARYEKLSKLLVVKALGTRSTDPSAVSTQATFLLKDVAGVEVARQTGSELAIFDKVAATACMLIPVAPGAGGSPPEGTTREVCAPVTVKTLAPTPAELAAYDDGLSEDCGTFSGCSVGHARTANGATPWVLSGILFIACARRHRRRVSQR